MKNFKQFLMEDDNFKPMPKRSDYPEGDAGSKQHSDALRAWAGKEKQAAQDQVQSSERKVKAIDTATAVLEPTEQVLDAGIGIASTFVPGGALINAALQTAKAGIAASDYGGNDYAKAAGHGIAAIPLGGVTKTLGMKGAQLAGKLGAGEGVKKVVSGAIQTAIPLGQIGAQITIPNMIRNRMNPQVQSSTSATSSSPSSSSTTQQTTAPVQSDTGSNTDQLATATTVGGFKTRVGQIGGYSSSGRMQSIKPGQSASQIAETWQEYNWRFGEDRKKSKSVLKKIRKLFNLPETMPGDE
jgi:hypothetical protein